MEDSCGFFSPIELGRIISSATVIEKRILRRKKTKRKNSGIRTNRRIF
jgi:hypothetical protein